MNLTEDLENRINPEKNRNFAPQEFSKRLLKLRKFAEFHWSAWNGIRISVVGTNGKGSVSHYLSELFRAGGYCTGVYSSPHLQHYSERIRIDGKNEQSTLEDGYDSLRQTFLDYDSKLWADLSYFELLSLLSMEIFQKKRIPVQIYEAGLGGRLDATSLCNPNVVLITRIALDHMALLGKTRSAIFAEKLGISGPDSRIFYLMECRYEPLARRILDELRTPEATGQNRILSFDSHLTESHSMPRHSESPSGYLNQNFQFAKWIVSDLVDAALTARPQNLDSASGPSGLQSLLQSPVAENDTEELYGASTAIVGPDNSETNSETNSNQKRLAKLMQSLDSTEFQDLQVPAGRMMDIRFKGFRWIYDSGHNPASLHTVLSTFSDPPLLVLGILPDRSYPHFLRVARWKGLKDVFCIEREGLAQPPGSDETAVQNQSNDSLQSRQTAMRLRTVAATSADSIRDQVLNCARQNQYSTILFTGSYRIYDLFLEILGPDRVHA
ncbi:MAG: hypothetical protein RH862_00675 [Leptospiraceae bacterium]